MAEEELPTLFPQITGGNWTYNETRIDQMLATKKIQMQTNRIWSIRNNFKTRNRSKKQNNNIFKTNELI